MAATVHRFAPPTPSPIEVEAMELASEHPQIGLPAHSHTFFELILVESGGGYHDLAGKRCPLRAGDLYAIPPGAVHAVPAPLHARGLITIFEPTAVLPTALGELHRRGHPLLRAFTMQQPISLDRARRTRLGELMRDLARETSERARGWQTSSLALLNLVLVETSRSVGREAEAVFHLDPLVEEVFDVIERRFREPLSLRDVAATLNRDPSRLTTTVKERTGRSVNDWIEERRMAEARRLLAHEDAPIGRVSAEVGLPDQRYFARRFRNRHGLSPARWRAASRFGPSR